MIVFRRACNKEGANYDAYFFSSYMALCSSAFFLMSFFLLLDESLYGYIFLVPSAMAALYAFIPHDEPGA
jgi:hypothetical protein